MTPRYDAEKTTQAACLLLQLGGGRLSILKLMKLLYLVDREALRRWGRSLSDDWWYSMPHGPVLSSTLNAASERTEPYWNACISKRAGWWLYLLASPPPQDHLSKAEIEVIRAVYREHGGKTAAELRNYCHGLPEYRDPQGSSLPITLSEILRAVGKTPEDVEAIQEETNAVAFARSVLE